MHVLITRPEPDARELKDALEALGHAVRVEPLLVIEPLPIAADAFADAQAILVTSRNGLRALAASPALSGALKLPLFAVGSGTSELARSLGFQRVIAGTGGARDLVPLIATNTDRAKGPLVHVGAETLAFDLVGALSAQGIAARKLTAYRALAVASLSVQTEQQILSGAIDAVLLMSPRTAAIFAQLVATTGLTESVRRVTCVCLSKAVADALGGLSPARIEIATEPNSSAMLAAVAQVARQSTGV